jgi:hypothetical protein
MSRGTPIPRPHARRAGVRAEYSTPTRPERPDPLRRAERSPLTDILPPAVNYRAWATYIPVPAGLTIGTQEAAWYGLRRRTIDAERFQEICVTGVHMCLLPADTVGGPLAGSPLPSGAPFLAWGDTTGLGAAVVVGKNLPFSEAGVWTSAPHSIPGLDYGNASTGSDQSLRSGETAATYIAVTSFPTGSFRDTSPNKAFPRWNFQPHAIRLVGGESLDVAFVIRRNVVNGLGTASALACLIDVQVTVGLTVSPTDWGG